MDKEEETVTITDEKGEIITIPKYVGKEHLFEDITGAKTVIFRDANPLLVMHQVRESMKGVKWSFS